MKKIIKKALVGGLALVMSMSTLAGCNKEDTSNTLVITANRQGYGITWLETIAQKWKEKTGNDYKIIPTIGNQGQTAIDTELESHVVGTDLYVTDGPKEIWSKLYNKNVSINGKTYETQFANLTELYNTPLEGENGATIKSKMLSTFAEAMEFEENYYFLPWTNGIYGIVRNKDAWNKLNLTDEDIPVTTDEMFALCDDIVDASVDAGIGNTKISPFIYSLEQEYYTSFLNIWFAQYEGREKFAQFGQGKDPDGLVTQYLYTYDGAEAALGVLNSLLNGHEGAYQHPDSKSLKFSDMQGLFLKGQSVFCVNGSWLEIEMGNYNTNIDYIKTPVVSSIINRLDTVEDDAELAEIIRAIDSGTAVPQGVSTEDYNIIKEARSIAYTLNGTARLMLVPAYGKVDLAEDFLKYMYSDEGMKIYYEVQKGDTLPLRLSSGSYPETTLSGFRKCINSIMANAEANTYLPSYKGTLFVLGGVQSNFNTNGVNSPTVNLLAGISPSAIIDKNTEALSRDWKTIQSKIQ